MLDYLNVSYADAHLIPNETKTIDRVVHRLARWTDARHFYKRILVEDRRAHPRREYVERVARFTREDFERMFAPHELLIEEVYGDSHLQPFVAATSPRLILVARVRRQERLLPPLGRRRQRADDALVFGGRVLLESSAEGGRVVAGHGLNEREPPVSQLDRVRPVRAT